MPSEERAEQVWFQCSHRSGICHQCLSDALRAERQAVWEEAIKVIESGEFLPSIYGNGGEPCSHIVQGGFKLCSCYHIYQGDKLLQNFRRRATEEATG